MKNNNHHFDMSDYYFSSKSIDGKPSKYHTAMLDTIKSWEQNPNCGPNITRDLWKQNPETKMGSVKCNPFLVRGLVSINCAG